MKTAPPHHVGIAILLAFLAGSVDGIGYSLLGGLFVSFMSGNSTRLGVALSGEDMARAGGILALIVAFVVGSGCGYAVARLAGAWRQSAILLAEALVLCLAATLGRSWATLPIGMLMAFAMGLENATFLDAGGETRINLTFMTGALVKLGQNLAALLLGEARPRWWTHLLLWIGLLAGAAAGATAFRYAGLQALFGVGALLVVAATVLRPRPIPPWAARKPGRDLPETGSFR